MHKTLFTLPILILICNLLSSQINATTEDGKKVILLNNGTWKYEKAIEKEVQESSKSNCDAYTVTTVDKVTGKSSISSKSTIIISENGGKKGFGILALKSSNSLILSIQAVGAGGCIDDDNKMNVLFRDGTRLELVNDGKFNCDARYTQYFGGNFGKKKELEMFQNKEVEIIRIWTSKSFVEEELTKEQSNELMNTIKCLTE